MGQKAYYLAIAISLLCMLARPLSKLDNLLPALFAMGLVMLLSLLGTAFGLLGLIRDEADAHGYLVPKHKPAIGLGAGVFGLVIFGPLFTKAREQLLIVQSDD